MGHPAYDEAARILTKSEDQRRLSQLGRFIPKLQGDALGRIPAFVNIKMPFGTRSQFFCCDDNKIQSLSVTVTPFTVTIGYSDSFKKFRNYAYVNKNPLLTVTHCLQ